MQNEAIDTARSEGELLDLLVPFMNCTPPFAETAGDRCMARGLLPGHLLDSLNVLQFLSHTVLAAQKAQRAHGVRASVLLSMALDESSFDIRGLVKTRQLLREYDGKRGVSPLVDRWFMKKASDLATSRRFKKALVAVSSRHYIEWISELGFCDSLMAKDLCHNVESYDLEYCDRAGMHPIGDYSREKYDDIRDALGNITGQVVSPIWKALLRMEGIRKAA